MQCGCKCPLSRLCPFPRSLLSFSIFGSTPLPFPSASIRKPEHESILGHDSWTVRWSVGWNKFVPLLFLPSLKSKLNSLSINLFAVSLTPIDWCLQFIFIFFIPLCFFPNLRPSWCTSLIASSKQFLSLNLLTTFFAATASEQACLSQFCLFISLMHQTIHIIKLSQHRQSIDS